MIMKIEKITVFGKNYITAPETNGCAGCAFADSEGECAAVIAQMQCGSSRIIFKEEIQQSTASAEQTFTASEVIEIMEYLGYGIINRDVMKSEMEKRSDPEYMMYLELKKKFG